MQITIYHNPNCGTSRNALAAIRNSGQEPRIVEYLKTPLSRAEIAALAARMGVPAHSIVRRKESLFQELRLGENDVTADELLDAMAEHPILINRPIVVMDDGSRVVARLCRPSALVTAMLAQANSA